MTIAGAKRLAQEVAPICYWVRVNSDAESFVVKGRSAFARHVVDADPQIRPNQEVTVFNTKNEVLAVGRALLTGAEMKAFSRGIAVRVRKGVAEKS